MQHICNKTFEPNIMTFFMPGAKANRNRFSFGYQCLLHYIFQNVHIIGMSKFCNSTHLNALFYCPACEALCRRTTIKRNKFLIQQRNDFIVILKELTESLFAL